MRHSWKNARHLEKCDTLKKMRDNCKIASHWKNASRLKMRHVWRNTTHLEKLGTPGKIGQV